VKAYILVDVNRNCRGICYLHLLGNIVHMKRPLRGTWKALCSSETSTRI